MSPQHIEIAAPPAATIHQQPVPEVAMTSPYLDHIRPPRRVIEDLITAREVKLAKAGSPEQRRRFERDLNFLGDELARIDGQSRRGWQR